MGETEKRLKISQRLGSFFGGSRPFISTIIHIKGSQRGRGDSKGVRAYSSLVKDMKLTAVRDAIWNTGRSNEAYRFPYAHRRD